MSSIEEAMRTMFADPEAMLLSVVVFVAVFLAVAAAGLRLLRPAKPDRTAPLAKPPSAHPAKPARLAGTALLGQLFGGAVGPRREPASAAELSSTRAGVHPKKVLRAISRGLSLAMMAGLVTLTAILYFVTDPNDGSRLVFWVMLAATALAGIHLSNADARISGSDEDAAMRADFMRTVESDMAAKLGAALIGQTPIQWEVASPEVHRIDEETLARAKLMAAEGRPMDEICRSIEPAFDGWSAGHQQAFQNVIRAAIGHGG